MKTLPLNMLRAFAAVYETGGVRPAGRLLGVTHSSVSRFVHELEGWLGTQLLDRGGARRTIAFTPTGEALGRAALKTFSELDRILTSIREAHKGNSVIIETTPSLAARWLLPRLGGFERDFGWIELSIMVDQRVRTPLDSGADFSLRMGPGPWPDSECIPLMDDALYPVMTPEYWRSLGKPTTPAGLTGCRLLHDRDPHASWALWKKSFGPETLNVQDGPRYSSSDLVLRAAEQGLGAALARDRFARDAIDAGTLIAPMGDLKVDLPRSIWIVRPENQPQKIAAQTVIDWLCGQV